MTSKLQIPIPFSRDRNGVLTMLALFKAYNPSQSPTLEETLTSWWHGGQSRFQFHPSNHSSSQTNLLVVFSSLGSGLARPEWNATLQSLNLPSNQCSVLFVLDPAFSWYCQDPACR
mmetsp:Transcript_55606/g.66857  ORF Transcript_55606/g.66857 Transcript_55606/m.66857 type:complete len:116 (-) Transcript_55606:721-1068(-)